MKGKVRYKKLIFTILLAALFLVPSCQTDSGTSGINYGYIPRIPDTENTLLTGPEDVSGKTAMEYFRDEELTVGWNIGNTFDAWNSASSGEGIWQPKVTEALLHGVKEAGFNVLRIPITWKGQMGPGQDYHISDAFLERVAEVVGWAKDEGFKAIIINLHHDGASTATADNGWLSINQARADEEGYNRVTFQFFRVWKQIAVYFKNHGDYLVFEAFNELHDGNWGWNVKAPASRQYEIINEWNQIFSDTVRGTGGNNETRFLMFPALCQKPHQTTANTFILPADSVPGRQIVTFHYYDPEAFSLNGNAEIWDTGNVRTSISALFANFNSRFIDNNIPVIIGETGPIRARLAYVNSQGVTVTIDQIAAAANRLAYIDFMFGEARKNELIPVYWDNGSFGNGGFGLFNRSDGTPHSASFDAAAVINAMIDAVSGD